MMQAALNLAGFGFVALFCIPVFGQASVDKALSEYNKKKQEILDAVIEAYDAEIEAAQEKGDLVKAKKITLEKDTFLRQEGISNKLGLNDAIREYQKRMEDTEGLDSTVQETKIIEENIDWLEKNLSRKQIKLEFTVRDVQQANKGYYYVYFGECETELGGFVQLQGPSYYLVKLSEKQAEEIGANHRLVVSGTPDVGKIQFRSASYPIFFIDEELSFGSSYLKLAIFMKDPTVKLIEK